MTPNALMTALPVTVLLATSALSADYEVERSLQLPASSTEIWHVIGDFCDIDDWHPEISACALKIIDGRLHRVLTTRDGAQITDRRIAEDPGLSYTYAVSASPWPVESFTATLSVDPGEATRVHWSARFSSEDASAEAAIGAWFDAGMAAIAQRLGAE